MSDTDSAGAPSPSSGPRLHSETLGPPYVHETAVVDAGAILEPGVKVWHFVHVCAGARIGRGTSLGQNVFVAPKVVVGAGCKIQNNVSLYEGVELCDEVFVGPSAVFTNVVNPRAHVIRRHEFARTVVGHRATIGANATIVCGTTLYEGAFVGAGAVVTQDVQPYSVVLGVPARPLGFACQCGVMLSKVGRPPDVARLSLRCEACSATYRPLPTGGLERTDVTGAAGATRL